MTRRYPFAVIKEKLHQRRGEVADFAIGARRVPLDTKLQEWIFANPALGLKAASPDEIGEFRNAAQRFLQLEYAVQLKPQQIVPVPSGRAGMSAFIACRVEPASGVVVTEPGYPAFARMAAHRHAVVHSVELDPQHDFAPGIHALDESDAGTIRVIALNYPNNPTAAVIGPDTRKIVEQAARTWSACIFNDAVYGPLIYDGQSHCLLSDAPSDIDLVELHSLTKLYPLGPLSGSFLAGSASAVADIATYSEFAWAPMSALQIRATTWCLEDGDGRHAIRDFYASQLRNLRAVLTEVGFEPYPTPSGIYALCRVPEEMGGQSISSAEQAAELLMDTFDIAVMPWDVGTNRYLRFCSMYLEQDLARLAGLSGQLKIANRGLGT